MCGLHLTSGGNIASDTLLRLTLNSPGGVLFPKLEWLHWDFGEKYIALTFFRLFLSPNLRRVTLYTDSSQYDIPWGQLAALVQVISFLPTSLQDLSIMFGSGDRGTVNNAVSSFFCRCGPSLRSFGTSITLSEAAVHHSFRGYATGLPLKEPLRLFQLPFSHPSSTSTSTNQQPYHGSIFLRHMKGVSFETVSRRRHRTQTSEKR